MVNENPNVHIAVTGNEFATELNELQSGKIFESNGIMLITALEKHGFKSTNEICEDEKVIMEEKISAAFEMNDVLLITGGVSVGDYDFTRPQYYYD